MPAQQIVSERAAAASTTDSDLQDVINLFQEVSHTFECLAQGSYASTLEQVVRAITSAFLSGHKLLVFGNGGSAADAQHICGELVGRFLLERHALPAIALTENSAVITAIANDYDYDRIFSRQVEAMGARGDVAWGISTSGNSKNVVAGLRAAKSLGMLTIGMTKCPGGAVADLSDLLLAAPVTATPRVQEVHLVTYHAVCAAVERRVCALKFGQPC